MDATVAVILPAAGKSSRFGGKEKKPFQNLAGRPIWQRTAELFWNRDDVAKVYIVISPEDEELFRMRYQHVLAFVSAQLVLGGAERFESVANALALVPEDIPLVAVHDAVRPLCTPEDISTVFQVAKQHGAAILATPETNTLKRIEPQTQTIQETVPRAGLWCAQTPQVFRRDWLSDAYAQRHQLQGITDDAQLVEAQGHAVRIVSGSSHNLKITTKDDLTLAEGLLQVRQSRPAAKNLRPFDDEAQW